MILENYINYETPVNNSILEIEHFNDMEKCNKSLQKNSSRLFIFVNLGNIIEIISDNRTQFCPPKSCMIGMKKGVTGRINPSHQFRGTLISCKKSFHLRFLSRITGSIEKRYAHIFDCNDFLFDFPLNIQMIAVIETIYKAQNKKTCYFHLLEIESLVIQLFIQALRIVIFLDQKYIEQFTTLDTKYYTILKTFFDHPVTFEDTLKLYNMERTFFQAMFEKKNPSKNLDTYLKQEKKKCEADNRLDINIDDLIEEAQEAD